MAVLLSERRLLEVVSAYCVEVGLSESRVSALAAGNPLFTARLRAGSSCTLRLCKRVLQWLSDHWPPHLEWPPDVPRPELQPSPAREEEKEAT